MTQSWARGDDLLSPGYSPADESRWVDEAPKRNDRTAFARDRARILHSAALRRLAAKTQVMAAGKQHTSSHSIETQQLENASLLRETAVSTHCSDAGCSE